MYDISLHLILSYNLTVENIADLKSALPPSVFKTIRVWEDATPLFDGAKRSTALARQHRLVIKDRINDFDFFSAWEDDTLVKRNHVDYFLYATSDILSIRDGTSKDTGGSFGDDFRGDERISVEQYNKIMPGFMRSELDQREI